MEQNLGPKVYKWYLHEVTWSLGDYDGVAEFRVQRLRVESASLDPSWSANAETGTSPNPLSTKLPKQYRHVVAEDSFFSR